MIGAILEVASVGKERHRPRRLPRQGRNKLSVRGPDRVGGWLCARACDQSANCVRYAISLGHWVPPLAWVRAGQEHHLLLGSLFSDNR